MGKKYKDCLVTVCLSPSLLSPTMATPTPAVPANDTRITPWYGDATEPWGQSIESFLPIRAPTVAECTSYGYLRVTFTGTGHPHLQLLVDPGKPPPAVGETVVFVGAERLLPTATTATARVPWAGVVVQVGQRLAQVRVTRVFASGCKHRVGLVVSEDIWALGKPPPSALARLQ